MGEGRLEPRLVLDAFFNAPHVKPERIGGWYVYGHDAHDAYAEFVVIGAKPDMQAILARVRDWRDWVRVPLEIGSPLL